MNYDQSHWIPVRQRRPLPTFYYHAHFTELLEFVAAHYAHALGPEHRAYLDDFARLPRDAQCLYVRLVNRKGRLFDFRRLRYPELGEIRPIIARLEDGGWVGPPAARHAQDVYGFLTRAELYEILLPRFAGLSRSLKKDALVAFAAANLDAATLAGSLDADRVLVQRRVTETLYLLYLFFGRIRHGLTQFTMRDLGLVQTRDADETFEPRFSDRDEALEHFYFAVRIDALTAAGPADVPALVAEIPQWPATNYPGSAALRDELALELGKRAGQAGMEDAAIACFRRGESARCSERLVRLLLRRGDRSAARSHLERCLEQPRSDEEWLVARDLYDRKFNRKRTSSLTDLLRAADVVELDESGSGAPERAVIEYFQRQGHAAFRSENLLWRTLFGLIFWDELFGTGEALANSPFDFLPAELVQRRFYAERRDRIEARLALVNDPLQLKRELLKTSLRFYGKPNGIFRWRRTMNDAIFALVDHGPATAIRATLRRLAADYPDNRYGYPDLLVIDDAGARFLEVKAEGDQLRRNQLLCIGRLREDGFRADVLRVRWVLDPDQSYVVVDVETTGGRGENHRVTEIGAVKVKDGRIVDRFQTLLNPQRSIPPNISRLTGITPAMVANAPYFADIADEFEAFLDGSIFVAHNVAFDYGFIGREFRRIGRAFRYPKLCTCASMRRLYPGHRSYSLAALCREYAIPLRQHHRALCDAEAAAELLLLINEKRQAA